MTDTKTKFCNRKECQKPYQRKKFRGGSMESPSTFENRRYCSQKCSRDEARKFVI